MYVGHNLDFHYDQRSHHKIDGPDVTSMRRTGGERSTPFQRQALNVATLGPIQSRLTNPGRPLRLCAK